MPNKHQIATWSAVTGLSLGLGAVVWQYAVLRHRVNELDAEISSQKAAVAELAASNQRRLRGALEQLSVSAASAGARQGRPSSSALGSSVSEVESVGARAAPRVLNDVEKAFASSPVFRQAQRCLTDAGIDPEGVELVFKLDEQGLVTGAVATPVGDPAAARCVTNAAMRWKDPQRRGPMLVLRVPLSGA